MSTSYTIDAQQALVCVHARDVFTSADLRDHYHALCADARFQPSYSHLTNLAGVTDCIVESTVIAEVASWPVSIAGTRRAIVAPSDLAYGLSRMFSLHAEQVGQNVMVFRTESAAVEWLNSPIESAAELDIAHDVRDACIRAA